MHKKQKANRLINKFVPDHYDLHITQDSEKLIFSGHVVINGKITDSIVSSIVLHSNGLNITATKINDTSATNRTDNDTNELSIDLPINYKKTKQKITVYIEFSGNITRQMHGLYLSSYDCDGEEKRILATQFESHHAREVFPCIDEPAAKATFQLHLTTTQTDVCISNTPVESVMTAPERPSHKTVSFASTPRMSTYLLAWASGELVVDSYNTPNGPKISVYSSIIQSGKGKFALGMAERCVEFLESYFNIPYPLAKLDLVALPDFSAAGMENWGMITFRDSCLLIDEHTSDLADKRYVAEVIAHEVAHQWFGNLVTMTWWDDLWLNEGFASWMSYLILDNLEPTWKVWEQLSAGDLPRGLRADALNNSHPVVLNISNPNEIAEAFDRISYDKGCAVVELLYKYIGPKDFQKGLTDYLKDFSYKNATTADLWRHWSEASGKNIVEFMRVWTEVQGFPIIEVTDDSISQKQFLLEDTPPGTVWPIPLMKASGSNEILETKFLLSPQTGKLNVGQTGFYRVLYSGDISAKINNQIRSCELPPIDALGVVADSSECAKAGTVSSVAALELMLTISKYTNEPLISSIIVDMIEFRTVFTEQFDTFKPFFAKFIEPNYSRLGIELVAGEDENDQLLRPSILAAASFTGDKIFIDYAYEAFTNADTPESLRPDLRSVIYGSIANNDGTLHSYQKLLNWYDNCTLPGEQDVLAAALMGFTEPELVSRSLEYCISGAVKLQDVRWWVSAGLRGRLSRHITWGWLKTNWQFFVNNYGSEKDLGLFVSAASKGFASAEHQADYTSFFASSPTPGAEMAYKQGIETIQWQTKWKTKDQQRISEWLATIYVND
jgi:aminopeptidase N